MWARWMAVAATIVIAGCEREQIEPFSELDRDGDSRISREEASANASLDLRFSDLDADEDGELSAREYLQAAVDY